LKKINYYNKELKDNFEINDDSQIGITEDNFEIKSLSIQIEDKDLDYYLNIINNSYSSFGKVTVEDIQEIIIPSESDRIIALENAVNTLMGVE
jgi:hypothetical protein